MRRTFVRPAAQTDIREAARWYETREAGLGARFISEIRVTLQHVADNPLRFPIVAEDVRRALLHKFPVFHLLRQRSGCQLNNPFALSDLSPFNSHRLDL